jgi:hypothetical protein
MTYKDFIVIFHAKKDIKMEKMTNNQLEIAQSCLPVGMVPAQKNIINLFNRDVR